MYDVEFLEGLSVTKQQSFKFENICAVYLVA